MASTNSHHEHSRIGRMLTALVNRPGRVLLILGLLTAVFVVVGIKTTPDTEASFDPGGGVFDTAVLVERTFRPSTTELQFIVEDESADALDLATLSEWKQNSDALRSSDELSGAFSTYFDNDLSRTIVGLYTIADAVDDDLRSSGVESGLGSATEDDVKLALNRVLDEERPTGLFRDALSVDATSKSGSVGGKQITVWTSPAFLATVRVDHDAFPVDLESKIGRAHV